MEITFLSSKNYSDPSANNGDCIIISNNGEMLVYDCGCYEHADRVINIMKQKGINKVKCVLSHNDKDHFEGFLKLIEKDKVEKIYTVCALKHVDDILKVLNDGRRKRDATKENILEKFSNIEKLSGFLEDIYDSDKNLITDEIITGVNVVAPDYDYMVDTVAKAINNAESDTKDGDSIMNAASVCLQVESNKKLLLTGDSTYENICDLLEDLDFIQLPHHGREAQLLKITEDLGYDVTYIVSDNTGSSNGGCDVKNLKGYSYRITTDGDVKVDFNKVENHTVGTFGV